MEKKRYASFLSRRSIVSLIGIDYNILEKTGHDNYIKFYLSGFLVLLIFIISFISVFYAFDLMFDMWHAEILLSLFFGLTFFNIYIFLIQTFSKEVFPSSLKLRFFNLSNLSRIIFVIFIGFLIAQPVKIYSVRHQLDSEIITYKQKLIKDFSKKNEAIYSQDLKKLELEYKHFSSFARNETVNDQLKHIEKSISEIYEKIEIANLIATLKITASNFIIKRIELANKFKAARLIELLILLIFCVPIGLIYSISGESKYYLMKKESDKNMVLDHYESFKKQYQKIFKQKHEVDLNFYEPYLDPPFNTKRIIGPTYSNQEDFFQKYL
jgi:hypothetical protein